MPPASDTDNRAVRSDGTSAYAKGESFKTGSSSKEERLEAFVDWLLTPESEREPRTKKAWAEQWGVTPQTVRNDAREAYVQRELAVRARAVARVEDLPQVIGNLMRIATGSPGDPSGGLNGAATPPPSAQVSAAKTLLDWWARTEPVREADMQVSELTNEQLIEAALRMLDQASDGAS